MKIQVEQTSFAGGYQIFICEYKRPSFDSDDLSGGFRYLHVGFCV